jgi:hypothetical protein
MAGSGVRSSWAASIVGDFPPPTTTQQSLQKVNTHKHAHDQVIVSIPHFHGRLRPDLYIEWEFEINDIFVSHNFLEHKKVKTAISAFKDFASIWWNEYCSLYPDYIPNTWNDLKLAMRYRFVPSYYTRDKVRKLQNLKQGTKTVSEYYDALETTFLHSLLEESEEYFMDIFWEGLNRDIQDILIHEKCYPMDRLFRLACKAEQEIDKRVAHKTKKGNVQIPRVEKVVPSTTMGTMTTTSIIVSTPPISDPSSLKGNDKGMDLSPPHENHVHLNAACVELSTNLITQPILEDMITSHEDVACLVDLNTSCVELPADLITPSLIDNHVSIMKEPMFNHFDMTSNLDDDYTSNDLLHDCLVKPIVACPSKIIISSILGWFNDEHFKSLNMNKSFTYMCKLSCNTFMSFTYCDISIYFTTYESYSCMHVLHVHKLRYIKMDDIYIYHVYTLSLLFDMFQVNQRRGRLYFQEGEDDEDMATMDTTKNIINSSIFDQEMKSIQRGMIVCCTRSYFTSLLAQEKIENKSLTSWTQIRTAEIYPTSNSRRFYIRSPNWVILFSGDSLSRLVSNPIGFTFKFLLSVEISRKRCDPAAESESKSNSIGVASPPHGPKCLVRPRFSFRTPWDVLPPPWPPPFSPI